MAPPKKEQKALVSANEVVGFRDSFLLHFDCNKDFTHPVKMRRIRFVRKVIGEKINGYIWKRCGSGALKKV